ncbi:MAG: ABC transporter substrate-binding protein [Bacillota bacterium]
MLTMKSLFMGFLCLTILFTLSFGLTAAEENKELAGSLTGEEMWEYKALEDYKQAPTFENLVDEGKLPSVEDRLPDNPRVIKKTMMVDGIGEYGGVWRDTFAVPVEGWNWAAGQTQGYFGINQMVQQGLVDLGPMWMMETPEVRPRLATDWEWSEDGKTLTMNLIEGAHWSDGEPFDADDVVFTYEHMILDSKIPSIASSSTWTFGGEVTELEKVDDYTIKWHFGVENPIGAFYNMDVDEFGIAPAHIFEPIHPEFNEDNTYEEFINSKPPEDLPVPTMGPYVPVEYAPGEMLVLVRNPYFWAVDEDGQQLPYLDEVWFTEGESGEARTLNLISDSGDRTNIENPEVFSTVRQGQQEGEHIDIIWGPMDTGFQLYFNLSLTKGLDEDDEEEREARELFRDLDFRKAVSHALDREGLAEAVFPDPEFVSSTYGPYPDGSPYYDRDYVTRYEFNPEKAKEILTEMGFEDTDGDDIRNWPEDSPKEGDDLRFSAIISEDQDTSVSIGEAMQAMLEDVGIRVDIQPLQATVADDREDNADFQSRINRYDFNLLPDVYPESVGPVTNSDPGFHQAGSDGEREFLDFETEIRDLLDEAQLTPDPESREEKLKEVQQIYSENLYSIPILQIRTGLGINNRLQNVADDVPVALYHWTIRNLPQEIIWTPAAEQIDTQHQDKFPLDY